ncbi:MULTISPECIES: papain-like cysteine protease family protein [Hyphomonas]|uniref:papain-like cysteine protease family protein n=1 Tax=Hyphomonas TaxID=85 RepID=UPI00135F13E0|nr:MULTISPECIES: papain-like cysteine protease family protein [Hyphomonas]
MQALIAATLTLSACAIHPSTDAASFAARTDSNSFEMFSGAVSPPETLLLPVEHDQQINGIACGAHALASLVNYWHGAGTVAGTEIFATYPPADQTTGYAMSELLQLAETQNLVSSAVRLPDEGLKAELEAGRPVLVPVEVPSIFVQTWQLPGMNVPVLGLPAEFITSRAAWLSEKTNSNLLNHYVLVSGYDGDTFIVMEPVMGLRTISAERLARYRAPFGNAAIVFSKPA